MVCLVIPTKADSCPWEGTTSLLFENIASILPVTIIFFGALRLFKWQLFYKPWKSLPSFDALQSTSAQQIRQGLVILVRIK